jgi:hypothetical protein
MRQKKAKEMATQEVAQNEGKPGPAAHTRSKKKAWREHQPFKMTNLSQSYNYLYNIYASQTTY